MAEGQQAKKKLQWRKMDRRKRAKMRGRYKPTFGNRVGIDGQPATTSTLRKKVGQPLPPSHPATWQSLKRKADERRRKAKAEQA